MGDFADLASPFLTGHSAGVADARGRGRAERGLDAARAYVRRAALVHDIGRVAVPVRVWQKPGPLTPDERERVRLHAYHSERILDALAVPRRARADRRRPPRAARRLGLPPRRAAAAALTPAARLLAAADAYHAMTEPRPHRPPLPPERAAELLADEARTGRLDADAVAAVLAAAGQRGAAASSGRRG